MFESSAVAVSILVTTISRDYTVGIGSSCTTKPFNRISRQVIQQLPIAMSGGNFTDYFRIRFKSSTETYCRFQTEGNRKVIVVGR